MTESAKTKCWVSSDNVKDCVATFISDAPVAAAMFDLDMRYVAWSRVWADRFGTGDRDLAGLCHYDVFPNLPEHLRDAHHRALDGEEVALEGERFEAIEGQTTWGRWSIKPIKDTLDKVVAIIAFPEDITEQIQAKENLRANEARLQLVIDMLGAGVAEWNRETGETITSPYFRGMLGLNDNEVPTDLEGWIELLKPKNEHAFRQALRRVRASKDRNTFRWDIEPIVFGTSRKMQLAGRILFDKGDDPETPSGFIGILLDDTERKDLKASLASMRNLETIGRISGIIAHDFNNLLSVVLANTELAMQRISDSQTSQLLQNAINAVAMGGAFNKKLLALSGKRETSPQLIRVDEHLLKTWVIFERLLNEHITLKFLPGANELCVRMDPAELDGAVLNLVVNARDAQPKGGTITISTRVAHLDSEMAAGLEGGRPGDFLEISVEDVGIGMTKSQIKHAREPFFTTKEPEMGTGLGLTSVANAIARVHGFMSIQSTPGQGAKVSLFVPVADCHPAYREQNAAMPFGNGELVLVVEDDAMVREANLNRLEALGYAVIEASNGHAALELLNNGEPVDLVFSDIVMPGELSGFDLEQVIEDRFPGMAVLLTTGHTSKPQRGRQKGKNRAELLKKPYSLATLAQAVARALRSASR